MTPTDIYVSLLEHFARYFEATDTADFDAVVGILDGAVVCAGALETDDPETIRQAYAARHPVPDASGRRGVKNHVTNLVVDGPDESGQWRAAVYYFRLEADEAGRITVGTSGRLVQTLRRQGESWRVVRHEIIADL